MNILVVTGSPRVGGNSSMLADSFIEGAQAAGNHVERINAGTAKIAGCTACEYCFKHEGVCCQDDDMQTFYPQLRNADVLVYAFPLYNYSYPAQVKAFMDRMFCGMVKPFGIKKVALLLCFEDKDPSTADGLIQSFDILAHYCKQDVVGKVIVHGVYESGAIKDNPGLQQAYDLGASLS